MIFFTFIFTIAFVFNNLQSSFFSSLMYTQRNFRNDIDRVGSLNMDLIGMWNYGYPLAIYTRDDNLYLGSGGSVIIYDISDVTNAEKMGCISFPGYYVRGIFVLDTLMFIGDGDKGLRIASVSDPSNPIEVSNYESFWVQGVFAKNQLAYTTEYNGDIAELVIYNVSDPQTPNILSKDTLPVYHPEEVLVKDGYAYVANGQGGLRIIDVADSTNPFETGYFIPSGYTQTIAICSDTLLLLGTAPVGDQDGGLWVVNIKDPYSPYPMGCDTSFWCGYDVSYFSHYAYVSSWLKGVKIIDFVDPSNPHIVGEFFPSFIRTENLYHTSIGDIIYTCERFGNALRTIDASEPTNPVTIDYDFIPDRSIDVSVQGDYAYVANCLSGVYSLDVSDPYNPKDISHYDTKGRSTNIIAKDSIAYIADSASIILLSIKDPFNLEKISEIPLLCDGYGLALNYPYLYVTSRKNHQFTIVDVSVPQNPAITGVCDLDGNFSTYICYKDSFAYVSANPQGIAIINTADVFNPSLETYFSLPFGTRGMGYKGNYLYAAADGNFICILDISEPTNPVLIDTFHTRVKSLAMSISDTLLYVLFEFKGVEAFDISSPALPQSVGYYTGLPLCVCRGITSANGLAYLAADNGIYIFQCTGGTGKKEKPTKEYSESNISFKCYPTTFSSKIFLEVSTSKEENIRIELYNVVGRKIKNIFTGRIEGKRLFIWEGIDNNDRKVSSGLYFLRMISKGEKYHQKLIFIQK